MKADKDVCPICASSSSKIWLSLIDDIEIDECMSCGIGYVNPYLDVKVGYYEDYGDYITKLPNNYFKKRLRLNFTKSAFFSILGFMLGKNIKLLDYGGGAGFFLYAAKLKGFYNIFLLEPSKNFRRAAVDKVGLHKEQIFTSLNESPNEFDFVSMLDVIEHLPQKELSKLISELSTKMQRGGYLFGETPNKRSLNIFLFKSRDPVICPPSHVMYFTKNSLDFTLRKHGFKKVLLLTKGLSTNAFFRKEKFKPSYIEMPSTKTQKLFAKIVKLLFVALSVPLSFTGHGYQIVFLYRYEGKKEI